MKSESPRPWKAGGSSHVTTGIHAVNGTAAPTSEGAGSPNAKIDVHQ